MDTKTLDVKDDERELLLPKKKLINSTTDVLVILTLLLLYFSSSCLFSIILPIYTSEAVAKGTTTTVAGLVFATYPFGIFLVSPFVGKYLPKLGPIRTLIAGSFLEAFGEILFGFITLCQKQWMFVLFSFLLRAMTAVGAALSKTAIFSILWVLYPDQISLLLGMLAFAMGVGVMVGPSLGGLLYTISGFKLPFVVMGLFALLMLGGVVLTLPRRRIHAVAKGQSVASIIRVLRIPGIAIVAMCTITAGICTSFFESTTAVQLQNITKNKFSKAQIGAFFLFTSISYMISAPLCGYIVDKRISGKYVIVFGHALVAVAFVLLGPVPFLQHAFSSTILSTAISLTLLGIAIGPYLVPVVSTMKGYAVESGLESDLSLGSMISGLYSSLLSIGKVLGPIIGGLMLQYSTFAWGCFVIMATILIDGIILTFFLLYDGYRGRKK